MAPTAGGGLEAYHLLMVLDVESVHEAVPFPTMRMWG